jgi:hypothetical protein
MRVVIDTNIWVSGLLWQGDPWRLLRLAEARVFDICLAYPMLLELEEVLAYERFAPRLTVLQQTPDKLAAYALSLSIAVEIMRVWPPIVDADPDDDLFILCAVAARADYLITADRHLLALGVFHGIPIVPIGKFLQRVAVAAE